MSGAPRTSGLLLKRSSFVASSTTKRSSLSQLMACAQNESRRFVCEASSPTRAKNHWRSRSTSEIRAMGTWQIAAASLTTSSSSRCGGVSRMSSENRASMRLSSFAGIGGNDTSCAAMNDE
eukprot:Amastigsp_a679198_5.p2 type:complete len:121 gc:universal Amastigsp_a679198_5:387-25(-)